LPKYCKCEEWCETNATDMLLLPLLGNLEKNNSVNLNSWDKNDFNKYCACDCPTYKTPGEECYVVPKFLPEGWIDDAVCPQNKPFQCKGANYYNCAKGYYPVCGTPKGKGMLTVSGLTISKCNEKCTITEGCIGAQFSYTNQSNLPVGTCVLFNKNAEIPFTAGNRTCYRYNSECPQKIPVPVVTRRVEISCDISKFKPQNPVKIIRKCYTTDRLPSGWIDDAVCPENKKWKCPAGQEFKCGPGYYPVCADMKGYGFKRYDNLTIDQCDQKCTEHLKCLGAEYSFSKAYHLPVGSCLLNDRNPDQGAIAGKHTCYRYNAKCPSKIPTPVVLDKIEVPCPKPKKPCQCKKFCNSMAISLMSFKNYVNDSSHGIKNKVPICHCDCSIYYITVPGIKIPEYCECYKFCKANPIDMFFEKN